MFGMQNNSYKKIHQGLLIIALGLSSHWAVAAEHSAEVPPLIDLEKEAAQNAHASAEHKAPQAPKAHKSTQATAHPSEPAHPAENPKTAQKSTHKAHWSYEGAEGPEHWGDLDPKFISCKIGRNQSPINIKDKTAVNTVGLPGMDVYYQPALLHIINNGHTVQVNYPLGSYIVINGDRYELLQFHFHTPSEHQKNGFNYPMEMHIVHKDGDGNLAVIGILFKEGKENDALADIIRYLPKDIGKEHLHKYVKVNPVDFFPKRKLFYKYSGSLTTPPCSEGVYWIVFKDPIEASAEQIAAMHAILGNNNRPVQPHYARHVLKSWNATRANTMDMVPY